MTSTLGMAILGFVAREPLTGYEITHSVKSALQYFWQAGHSQVYPELARLEAAGYLTHERIGQQGKPDQKRYAPTEAGMQALREWLTSPLNAAPRRSEMAVRAFCVGLADKAAAQGFFDDQAARHAAQLSGFEQYKAQLDALPAACLDDPGSAQFAEYAVVMRGIGFERTQLEWCLWMAKRLRASESGRASSIDS